MRRILTCAFASILSTAAIAGEGEKAPAAGNAKHGQSSTSPYYMVDPIPISIIRDSAGRGLLIVEIGLDAKTLAERAEVEHLMPRLRDLYIRALSLYAARDLNFHQPSNPRTIKTRLQAATDAILGPGKATVLLRQVLERRTG
jgi:flagellar basal body-associated protein FliL